MSSTTTWWGFWASCPRPRSWNSKHTKMCWTFHLQTWSPEGEPFLPDRGWLSSSLTGGWKVLLWTVWIQDVLQCLLRPALGDPQTGHLDALSYNIFSPSNLVVGQPETLWTVSFLFTVQVQRLQHGVDKNMPPRDKRFSNGQLQDTSKRDSCDAFFNWYFHNVVPWMYSSTLFWFTLHYFPPCFCLGQG